MKNKYLFLFTFLTCLMVGCSTEIIEYYNPEVEGDSEQPKPDPIEYSSFASTQIM